jgi:hypothetical protein
LTLKICCCFLEVFFDLLPLSLDVSIMTNVSSFLLCSTATAIYFCSELIESLRAGTLCGGRFSTFLVIWTLSFGRSAWVSKLCSLFLSSSLHC